MKQRLEQLKKYCLCCQEFLFVLIFAFIPFFFRFEAGFCGEKADGVVQNVPDVRPVTTTISENSDARAKKCGINSPL